MAGFDDFDTGAAAAAEALYRTALVSDILLLVALAVTAVAAYFFVRSKQYFDAPASLTIIPLVAHVTGTPIPTSFISALKSKFRLGGDFEKPIRKKIE